jgi:pimeloyl-ACP methyl ester carboxylesterase
MERWWTRIARVHFDTEARVAALDVPTWVAHGALDLVIPPRMGRAVHAAARRPGQLLVVPTAGHNDVARAGGERYWRWLTAALAPAGAVTEATAGGA